jgi:hypothetical protein
MTLRVSNKLRTECQCYYVLFTRSTYSVMRDKITVLVVIFLYLTRILLDKMCHIVHNYHDIYGYKTLSSARSQNQGIAFLAHPESSPGNRSRPGFPRARIFRCPRCRAGKIRDASPPPYRGRFCNGSSALVRYQPSGLLQCARELTQPRNSGFDTQIKGTTAGTQVQRRATGLCRTVASQHRSKKRAGPGRSDSGSLRNHRAPPLHRPGTSAAEKKTPCQQQDHSLTGLALASVDADQQYERLRQQALADDCSSNQGHGLAVFLQRGMAAWLNALLALTPRSVPSVASFDATAHTFASVQGEMTLVLAHMVLCCLKETYQ